LSTPNPSALPASQPQGPGSSSTPLAKVTQQGMRSLGREIPWVLPLLLTVIVVATYLVTYDLLVLCSAPFMVCQAEHGITEAVSALLVLPRHDALLLELAAFRGRLIWTISVGASILVGVLSAVVALAALLYSSKQIRGANRLTFKQSGEYIARPYLPAVLIALAVVLPISIPVAFYSSHGGNPAHPWRQLMSESLQSALPQAAQWTPIMDMVGLGLGLLVAWTACALLKSARVQEDLQTYSTTKGLAQPSQILEAFHDHANLLKGLLYTGASLLVVTVFRAHAMLDWELGFLRPDPSLEGASAAMFTGLEGIVTTIITSQGLFFSLMLAALFVPAYLMLRTSGRETLAQITPADARDKQLELWEAHFNATRLVPKLLAILAPLLSAPISQYLQSVFS